MRRLHDELIGRKWQFEGHQSLSLLFAKFEIAEQVINICLLEIERRHFHFVLMENIAVLNGARWRLRPDEVINRIDVLQVHCQALNTVRNFTGNR